MYTSFFYHLREQGLHVSIQEWMTMLTGLKKGLHHMTLMGFYHLCRATLIKTETDYDKFDIAFISYFHTLQNASSELPEDLLHWLQSPDTAFTLTSDSFDQLLAESFNMDDLFKRFDDLLKEQQEEHNGGSKWIGRNGYSPFGNNGKRLGGIRIGGNSQNRSAFQVIGERRYRDFRNDAMLDNRQFQMAFRKLRQLSEISQGAKTELDVDQTINETGRHAGQLNIIYKRPRKNNMKVLLLIDNGGSMDYYATLCNLLFQSIRKTNTLADLKTFYFHNCIYDTLYMHPQMRDMGISFDQMLHTFDSEYRVIIVGDAMMAPEELHIPLYNWKKKSYNTCSGIEQLSLLQSHFSHIIWLNPQKRSYLRPYWAQTYDVIARQINMFDLSIDGLEKGIMQLMSKRF